MSKFIKDYWSSFREELIATSLVLITAVAGSFVVVERIMNPNRVKMADADNTAEELSEDIAEAAGVVLGEEVPLPTSASKPAPTATLMPTATPEPTGNPFLSEVYYGTGGLYDNEQYKLSLSSPRLMFDARNTQSRTFVVDVVVVNKAVPEGLQTTLGATIVKDGVMIVSKAAMSVTPNAIVPIGQQAAYTARLSLIEGTDVSLVHFSPGSAVTTVDHILRP